MGGELVLNNNNKCVNKDFESISMVRKAFLYELSPNTLVNLFRKAVLALGRIDLKCFSSS